MDVTAVTGQVTLLPESSGEVLVDVVNTEDVIDALDVDLDGIPGASVRIESATPTLFPGERRRLALRVQLPSQVPAGRHRTELEVRGVATGHRRLVDLDVDVPPLPGMAAGTHPALRRAARRVEFPVTVTNSGNTALQVLVSEFDAPDGVTTRVDPAEFTVPAWSSRVCQVQVANSRRLVGGDIDHVVDLRVAARATTPGQLVQEDLTQETRLTFRQRPLLSPGILLAVVLLTVAALWLGGGYFGLKLFIRLVDPGPTPADSFFPGAVPTRPDVAVFVAGQVVAEAGGSPVAGVTVVACNQEPTGTGSPAGKPPACSPKTATARTVSDGNGQFWLPGLFPGPYRLAFSGTGLTTRTVPVQWFDASCSLREPVSARSPESVTVAISYPADAGPPGPVKVAARLATLAPTPDAANPTSSPAPSGSTTPTAASAPPPPCSGSAAPAGSRPAPTPTGSQPAAQPTASPTAQPTASPTPTVWRGRSTGSDTAVGTRTAVVTVPDLPAPARYNLTMDAGPGLVLTLREVHVEAGQEHPVIDVTLRRSPEPTPGAS